MGVSSREGYRTPHFTGDALAQSIPKSSAVVCGAWARTNPHSPGASATRERIRYRVRTVEHPLANARGLDRRVRGRVDVVVSGELRELVPRNRTEPESPATPLARTVEVRRRDRNLRAESGRRQGQFQASRNRGRRAHRKYIRAQLGHRIDPENSRPLTPRLCARRSRSRSYQMVSWALRSSRSRAVKPSHSA